MDSFLFPKTCFHILVENVEFIKNVSTSTMTPGRLYYYFDLESEISNA